jgi:hypothetical protein
MNKVRGLFRTAPGVSASGAAPSPTIAGFTEPTPATGEAMRGIGTGGGRPSSQLSLRKETPQGSGSGTPIKTSINVPRPPVTSRNSSTNTTTVLSQKPGPRPKSPLLSRQRHPSSLQVSTAGISAEQHTPSLLSPTSPAKSSSSSSSSSDSSSPVESRIIKRPPRFQSPGGDAEDDDSEPAFLPYRAGTSAGSSGATTTQDLGATLRGDPRVSKRPAPGTSSIVSEEKTDQSQSSDSSASFSTAMGQPKNRLPGPGPLSPRRTAELAGRSPRGRVAREGSDGTPSMGSSFSDLDGELSFWSDCELWEMRLTGDK